MPPTLSTDGHNNTTDSTRVFNGTVITKGSFDISEYGMCWSADTNNPTTANSKSSKSGNPSSFPSRYSIQANGLVIGKTYYYRAYAISNGVTTYGSVLNFVAGR